MTAVHDNARTEVESAPTVDERLWEALSTVRDPELDEAVTTLGFVGSAEVADATAVIRLSLPTYFCAPNFAYLMVADAYDAAAKVPGIETVDVQLDNHFAADEINAGVAAHSGFSESFPGQTESEDLEELRAVFYRKAHTANLDRVCRKLLADGYTVDDLAGLRLADVPDSAEKTALLRRRGDLRLPVDEDQPLVVNEKGEPVPAEQVTPFLRFAKTVRVSIEANSTWCRGLLGKRYSDGKAV